VLAVEVAAAVQDIAVEVLVAVVLVREELTPQVIQAVAEVLLVAAAVAVAVIPQEMEAGERVVVEALQALVETVPLLLKILLLQVAVVELLVTI
jgi:hypothetical protein